MKEKNKNILRGASIPLGVMVLLASMGLLYSPAGLPKETIDLEKNLKTISYSGVTLITDSIITCDWNNPKSNWKQCEVVIEVQNDNTADITLKNPANILSNLNVSMLYNGKELNYLYSDTYKLETFTALNRTCVEETTNRTIFGSLMNETLCYYNYTRNVFSDWKAIGTFSKIQKGIFAIKLNFDSPITTTSKSGNSEYTPNHFNFTLKSSIIDLVLDPEISVCSNLSTAGETYTLTADILDSTSPSCINITANNITLDCLGHLIDGKDTAGSIGVSISRATVTDTNITVKNCLFSDWYYGGVYILKARLNNITNVTVTSSYIGLDIYTTSGNNTIANVTLSTNTAGINFDSGDNNTLRDSTSANSTYGIYIYVSRNNTFYNNLFNNTINIYFDGTVYVHYWNTTNQTGTRIYSSGTNIGGNYWTNSSGTGYSDTCKDINADGFCDSSLTVGTKNFDYLPLSSNYSAPAVKDVNVTLSNVAYKLLFNITPNADCLPPLNQTDSIGIWNVTNNGTVSENIQMEINATISGIKIIAGNSSTCSNGIEMSTSHQIVLYSLGVGESAYVWMWMNVTTPGTDRKFKVNFTAS